MVWVSSQTIIRCYSFVKLLNDGDITGRGPPFESCHQRNKEEERIARIHIERDISLGDLLFTLRTCCCFLVMPAFAQSLSPFSLRSRKT